MRVGHGPLDATPLWAVFSIAFIVLMALLLLATTALH
jgi:hypothetical protein